MSFHFEELPNETKMLTMLGGELSNSATFFSFFANVSRNDCTDLSGTFGPSPECKWKPARQYSSGLKVIEKVDSLKSSLDGKPLSRKQKRTKVTESIARQEPSRMSYFGG